MKCTSKKADGLTCKANAMKSSTLCFSHNPEAAADKLAAVIKGGLATKARDIEPMENEALGQHKKEFTDLIRRVRAGEIPFAYAYLQVFQTTQLLACIERELKGIKIKYESNKTSSK